MTQSTGESRRTQTSSRLSSSYNSCRTACDTQADQNSQCKRREHTATARAFYIGVQRRRDAEKFVAKCQNFRIYHRLPQKSNVDLSNVPDSLKLYIVYKDSKANYIHYQIHRTEHDSYYLDCDNISFSTLDGLIRYYSIYVLLGIVTSSNNVELFPPKTVKTSRTRR